MCGRYTGYVDDCEELKTIYTEAKAAWPKTEFRSGEIYPTHTVPLLAAKDGVLVPFPGYWGFPGFKGSEVIINARCETAAEKPTFADAFRWGRCVVPTTGYFEWDRQKRKFLFNRPHEQILYLAGLYRNDPDRTRFVILTTAANASVRCVHYRMPVILDADTLIRWTVDEQFAQMYVQSEMPEMVRQEA